MLGWFERRLNPYPSEAPSLPPKGLFAFLWHYTRPAAPWLLLLGLCSMALGIVEVVLFQFLGNIIDWLSNSDPNTFIAREGGTLVWMAVLLLVILPGVGALHTMTMHQALAGNFPMIARWQMHRYLIRQSMSFFSNEFAGRVSTKVMQTSLAVREAVMKIIDVFVYVVSYFVSMIAVIASADMRLVLPLLFWLVVYILILRYFVPKLMVISREQADARSMMTGRIVDSYTNIATVKLFSHAGREETYAREGMHEFLKTVHKQMRLISLFNITIDINNVIAMFGTAAIGIYFWMSNDVSVGAVAVAVGLAMRINGMSQWVMWEVTALFENIGTVYDGMGMMTKPHDIKSTRRKRRRSRRRKGCHRLSTACASTTARRRA
jgi:ATP-binding cassette subfamily B multidrug efflux pump